MTFPLSTSCYLQDSDTFWKLTIISIDLYLRVYFSGIKRKKTHIPCDLGRGELNVEHCFPIFVSLAVTPEKINGSDKSRSVSSKDQKQIQLRKEKKNVKKKMNISSV